MKSIAQIIFGKRIRYMMSGFLLLVTSLISISQDVNIPDQVFLEHLIQAGHDLNNDGIIQETEGLSITEITREEFGVFSLKGIEAFTNLEKLYFQYNQLTELDLSQNINLKEVDCISCQLQSVDLSNLNLTRLNLGRNNLTSIDLDYMQNLVNLKLSNNEFTQIDVNHLTSLIDLDLSFNRELSNVDLSGLSNLEILNLKSIGLTELDVSTLVNITFLIASYNNLAEIDITSLPKLNRLELERNWLETIDLSNQQLLESLSIERNGLTTIDVTNTPILRILSISSNPFTELPISNLDQLKVLSVNNVSWDVISNITFHPDTRLERFFVGFETGISDIGQIDFSRPVFKGLEFLYLYHHNEIIYDFSPLDNLSHFKYSGPMETLDLNGLRRLFQFTYSGEYSDFKLKYLLINNGSKELSISLDGNEDLVPLEVICCDYDQIEDITAWAERRDIDCAIHSYCAFADFDNRSTLSGDFILENEPLDCPDDFNIEINNRQKINVSEGNTTVTYFTKTNGEYKLALATNLYNLTPIINNNYYNLTPSTVDIEVLDNSSELIQDFNLEANGQFLDLNVVLRPFGRSVPGFENKYILELQNRGSICKDGSILLEYDQDLSELISTLPHAQIQSPGILRFDYDIVPFERKEFEIVFEHNSPMDTPALNLGDILTFTVTDSNLDQDETPEDNEFTLYDELTNSYDPNDIRCLQGKELPKNKVGDFVHYLIRFENVGTANARNVVVQNSIDLEKFKFESLEILNSSHSVDARLLEGGSAEFVFRGINLPFDDMNNDGFILYKIRTKTTLQVGDEFSSQAQIFFDFNHPIITNTFVTEIIENVIEPKIEDIRLTDVNIFPNPAGDFVNVESIGSTVETIQIYNLQGRSVVKNSKNTRIDISDLRAGIYLVEIVDSYGDEFIQQLIKLD